MRLLIKNNFATQPDNGSIRLFAISIAFIAMASIAVTGRLASQLSSKMSFGLDDLPIVLSLVSSSI